MRPLFFFCSTLIALMVVASGLYVRLPGYQAIGLTLFGGCVSGLLVFGVYIALEDRKRSHDH